MAVPVMALAAMSAVAPAAAASAATAQSGPRAVRTVAQPDRVTTRLSALRGDNDNDVSGLSDQSPVCSALGAETIPTGGVVAKCLAGTRLI